MMLKNTFDFLLSLLMIIIFSPVMFFFLILIFMQDYSNPIYFGRRIGKNGKKFNCYKMRSMIKNAEKSGVFSTSSADERITKLGKFLRSTKLDELPQIFNVLMMDMSFVGPRPNVEKDVKLYTEEEMKLLNVKPGITDLASIVFSDEGNILKNSINPDKDYNELIRPWKSRLGIIYINEKNFFLDIWIIILTIINFMKRDIALKLIKKKIEKINNVDQNLLKIVLRNTQLFSYSPPGKKK